jgi:hypothetical protein
MGNTPSVAETNDKVETAFKDLGHDIERGANDAFTKTKDTFDEAFKKDGAGNQFLGKFGDVSNTIGDAYDGIGNMLAVGAGGATMLGQPELAIPLASGSAVFKGSGVAMKKIGDASHKTRDVIEKPKKDFKWNEDVPNIFY